MLALLATRRFGPLFATQFLGAFNDNLFKTTMLFEIAYRLLAGNLAASATLVTAAAGLFILPFFLFSGISGQLSDGVDKARVMRAVKLAELGILGVGAVALWLGSIPLLFAVLFGMGCHSTVFGPVKYAVLPQHLAPRELLGGTGLVEGGTFVAILLGQITGGLLPTIWAGTTMLVAAGLGIATSRQIPAAPPLGVPAGIDWNPWTASRAVLRGAFGSRVVWRATLAISWFWAVGSVYTSEFVPLVQGQLAASTAVATLFLVTFTLGIAAGSGGVAKLLGGRVSATAAPWAVLAMALGSIDLVFAIRAASGVHAVNEVGAGGIGTAAFLASPANWRVLADLFALAAAGGVFSVPLYALLQTTGSAGSRAQTIAANNIVNAAFQVGGTLLAGLAIARGVPIALVLGAVGVSGLLLWPLLRSLTLPPPTAKQAPDSGAAI